MGCAVRNALASGCTVVMLLLTAGDGGRPDSKLVNRKTGEQVTYPEGRLRAHEAAIRYWLQNNNMVCDSKVVGGRTIRYNNFNNQVHDYNLMLPDGYKGVGFAATNFETLEKLMMGSIGSISSIDGNVYTSKQDLQSTICQILSEYIDSKNNITIHIPESKLELNKNSHSDHIFLGKLMLEILENGTLGSANIKLYADYENHAKPINLSKDDERFHRQLNKVVDDVLIENGRPESVRTLHLSFLGKEYCSRSLPVG